MNFLKEIRRNLQKKQEDKYIEGLIKHLWSGKVFIEEEGIVYMSSFSYFQIRFDYKDYRNVQQIVNNLRKYVDNKETKISKKTRDKIIEILKGE